MATRSRATSLRSVGVLLFLVALMAGGFLVFALAEASSRPHAPLVSRLPLAGGLSVLASSQDPGNDGIGLFREIAVAGRVSENTRTLARREVRELIQAGWKLKPTTRVSSAGKFIPAGVGTINSITIANDRRANIYVAFEPYATVHQYQSGADATAGSFDAGVVLHALRARRPILFMTLGHGLNNG